MKKIFTLFSGLLLSFTLLAQTGPYWAEDVAPILYANCTKCHNPSGVAPFPLITYADAANEGSSIQSAVNARTMPPWPPDTAYTRFSHERMLSAQEIQTINDWVNNGMPQGNVANAPAPPVYTGAAEIANPDLIAQMQTYTVNTATDLYRCFVVPSGITNDEYITSVEVLPGNRNIVHHVLVYQDVQNTCVTLDNNDPGPGYTSFGGVGSNTATLIAGWVPGQGVWDLPANMGVKLQANSYIIMQVHYPGGVFSQVDSTQVRFTFASGTVRDVTLNPVINHGASLTNGPLFIPANQTRTFYAQEYVSMNTTLISIAPHMHLIGRQIMSYAVDPSNDTIPLISIPDWNFHWQGFYTYRQPVHVPFGSTLYAEAFYDNTANNPWNPNNPLQNVSAGEATGDEMLVIYYAYLPYLPGDENIIIDSTLLNVPMEHYPSNVQTPQLYDPYPVPADKNTPVTFQYFLPNAGKVSFVITDVSGRTVQTIDCGDKGAGFQSWQYNFAGLSSGQYFVTLQSAGTSRTKSVQVR